MKEAVVAFCLLSVCFPTAARSDVSAASVSMRSDRTGRSYWLTPDSSVASEVARMEVSYPNPDPGSTTAVETVTLLNSGAHPNMVFRRRFPTGEGPWSAQVRLVYRSGGEDSFTVPVARPQSVVRQPARNGEIYVGICAYGQNNGFLENANDLMCDIVRNDICNLCVGYNSLEMLLPAKWPSPERGELLAQARRQGVAAMSIYSGEGASVWRSASEAFDGRYFGDNIGEFASFLYQGKNTCPIPMDMNLQEARDYFVNRHLGDATQGWTNPLVFSTCGAALSCYELAGGIDFICNELWAIGAQNIAHASAEARGAARKWGPEYWGGWNAHDWQSGAIPYKTDQKFDSLIAGFLQEYIAGTSMIILESGAQGPQAWQYTPYAPGEQNGARGPGTYGGEIAVRYRRSVKRFYDWVKSHPRGDATPESKVAIALGNYDSYLGENGSFKVWCQHTQAERDARWNYGAPEDSQELVEDLFYPRPKELTAPYRNTWLAGTPYGQADVMQIDDDSTVADLSRYALLVFGGWNTMTPHVKDVLERYVENGGTLVMSRPELTTRVDRDYENYTDADLLPLFDELPATGAADQYVEKQVGTGRYFLFTAKAFPATSESGARAYTNLIAGLAHEVGQSATISAEAPDALSAICYGVYPEKAYFLNLDTVASRSFGYQVDGRSGNLTLAPCQIAAVDRTSGAVELSLLTDDGVWGTEPEPVSGPEPQQFYWTGAKGVLASYSNASNWRIGTAQGAVPSRCPTWTDTLYGLQDRAFDLGGGTCYVSGWDSSGDWNDYETLLTNGTLCVGGNVSTHGDVIRICDSAKLHFQFGSVLEPALMDATPHRQIVERGGSLVLDGELRAYKYQVRVEEGGMADVKPQHVETVYGTSQSSVIENAGGVLCVTNGLAVATTGSGGASGSFTLKQSAGELRLGGVLGFEGGAAPFALELSGGMVRLVGATEIDVSTVTVGDSVGFVLDVDRFRSGEWFFRSSDADLFARVKSDVMGQLEGGDCSVVEESGSLVLVKAGDEVDDGYPWQVGDPEASSVLAWTNGTGALRFDGEGCVTNFGDFALTPWATAAPSIVALEISEGVTEIPSAAISGLTAVRKVNGLSLGLLSAALDSFSGGVAVGVESVEADVASGQFKIGVGVETTDSLKDGPWTVAQPDAPILSADGQMVVIPVSAAGERRFYRIIPKKNKLPIAH